MAIEAYCDVISAYPGETVAIHAGSTESTKVRIDVRPFPFVDVVMSLTSSCERRAVPPDASSHGCGWAPLAAVEIGRTWRSGVYRADLHAEAGDTTQIYFIVKATEPTAYILLGIATATYDAYNCWPSPAAEWPGDGTSLYDHDSPTRGRRVSLHRPNPVMPEGLERWELRFAQWAAEENLSLDYCTSIDLHREPDLLSRYRLLLSVGHDEYWSKEMRDNVENFVAKGGNVAFFSGNTCLWQIRYEDESLVCYRDPIEDPLTGIDDDRVTVEWYAPPVNRPTNTLTGVGFRRGAGIGWGLAPSARQDDAAYQVRFPEHWVFENAKLAEDGTFGRGESIVGYETDAADFVEVDGIPWATGRDSTPENFVILATADLTGWHGSGIGGYATMGMYRRNGTVFTAGTVDWPLGLSIEGSAVPQITRNVIRRLRRETPGDEWDVVGTAPRLLSLAKFERNLFGLGADGKLWWREVAAQNLRWRPAGDAAGVTALGSTEFWSGRLVGVRDGSLVWRDGRPGDAEWHEFGELPWPECVDLTATHRHIFAVADGGLWVRTAALESAPWTRIGDGQGIVSLSSWWSILFALTEDGDVLRGPAETITEVTWRKLGKAPAGALAVAVVDGRVLTSTEDLLWWRSVASTRGKQGEGYR